MKHSLKYLMGSLMIAALTACGGGGGGGSNAPADPYAGAYGVNGQPGYLGVGDWKGGVVGQNTGSVQYQQFIYQFGGGGYTTILNLRIWSGQQGTLPAQMGFSINGRRMGGDGFMQSNGFLINNYTAGGYGGGYGGGYSGQAQCFPYPCNQQIQQPYGQQGTPSLQISAQFTDVCRSVLTIQIRFQNVVVAAGTITGYVQPSQFGVGVGYQPGYPYQQQQYGQPGYQGLPPQCNQQFAQPYQPQPYAY